MACAFNRWRFLVRLRKCRKLAGMTQKEAAALFRVTERQWQNYEGGQFFPTLEKFIEIADYFSVSIDYLLGRSDTPKMNIDLSRYSLQQQISELLEKTEKTPEELAEMRRLQEQYRKLTKSLDAPDAPEE